MNIKKFIWAIRGLLYKPFLKSYGWACYLGKPLYISGLNNIQIGNRTRIFPGIRMETIANGSIVIGNNVVIEQNVHIISMGSKLLIGDNVTIAPNVFITNVNHKYADISISVMDQGYDMKETTIGEGTFIGFGSSIQAGTRLGKHCVVASNTVVRGDVEDYCVVGGVPAKIIKKYNFDTGRWEKV